MKLRINFLKAPWPTGAAVGDVVEIDGDTVPGWALGKCVRVGDDVEVTAFFDKPEADKPKAADKPKK